MNAAISYGNNEYTRKALFDMKGSDLVALHNKLADKAKATPTKRFSTIGAGVERTWKLLEQVGVQVAKAVKAPSPAANLTPSMGNGARPAKAQAPKATKADTPKATKEPSGVRRGTNLAAPGFAPIPCREGSKQAVLLDKLCASKGATMAELVEALSGGNKPWTEATVRSGFGWDMKQKGYGVRSEFDAKGVERFFIVLPKGHGVPPHRALKTQTPKAHAGQGRLKV